MSAAQPSPVRHVDRLALRPAKLPAPRRTQLERRLGTRAALLEATLGALVELGYARTTTTEVSTRAGVAHGTLFKHFPRKADLLADATAHLFGELFVLFETAFKTSGRAERPVVAAVRHLWSVFCHPHIRAAYMLYAEAPSDPELHAALAPIVRAHEVNVATFAGALFPEMLDSPHRVALFETLLLGMQGAALQRGVGLSHEREEAWLNYLEGLVGAEFPRVANANHAAPASAPKGAKR